MILQVHDELVFDATKDEVKELKPLIIECMQTAMSLPNKVPVIAECGEGKNWLDAHWEPRPDSYWDKRFLKD